MSRRSCAPHTRRWHTAPHTHWAATRCISSHLPASPCIQAAEGTFFEQSESISEHITKLEQIVERIEHPAHRAIDEALEVAFDRGQALANKP